MKRIKLLFVFLIIIVSAQQIKAQSYVVDWRTEGYDTLTNYTSILYELLEEPTLGFYNYTIDMDFSFPFFGQEFNSITIASSSDAYFENIIEDYHVFNFAGSFERHYMFNLFSDWRMRIDTNEIDILKVEWRNVGIYDDITSLRPTYHYMNMQMWFYQNGIIEYHFGDINLANTPFYSKQTGFTWEDGECYGPWIGIQNADVSEFYYITGTNFLTKVATVAHEVDIYNDIPPFGRVFRFIPSQLVNTEVITANEGIQVYPVPVNETLHISSAKAKQSLQSISIFDAHGQMLFTSTVPGTENSIDFSRYAKGCYFVKMILSDGQSVIRKVIKNN